MENLNKAVSVYNMKNYIPRINEEITYCFLSVNETDDKESIKRIINKIEKTKSQYLVCSGEKVKLIEEIKNEDDHEILSYYGYSFSEVLELVKNAQKNNERVRLVAITDDELEAEEFKRTTLISEYSLDSFYSDEENKILKECLKNAKYNLDYENKNVSLENLCMLACAVHLKLMDDKENKRLLKLYFDLSKKVFMLTEKEKERTFMLDEFYEEYFYFLEKALDEKNEIILKASGATVDNFKRRMLNEALKSDFVAAYRGSYIIRSEKAPRFRLIANMMYYRGNVDVMAVKYLEEVLSYLKKEKELFTSQRLERDIISINNSLC